MKFYEFRYNSRTEKRISSVLNFANCLIYPIIVTFIFLTILLFLGLRKSWPDWISPAMYGIAAVAGIVMAVIYATNMKGVLVGDDCIEIQRYSVTDFHFIPNIEIRYEDIVSIYNSNQRIPRGSWKAKKFLIVGGDLSNYVEIVLKGGKEFNFSVENQKEFVNDVISRMQTM